jgi:hypothetical protein
MDGDVGPPLLVTHDRGSMLPLKPWYITTAMTSR